MTLDEIVTLGFPVEYWNTWRSYLSTVPSRPSPHFRFIRCDEVIPAGAQLWSFFLWRVDHNDAAGCVMGMNRHRMRQFQFEKCPGRCCPFCPKEKV